MKTSIGISAENREVVAHQLAILLADEFVLYTKTLNAHWNLEGMDFHSVHLYFEELYTQSAQIVDDVAERIRQLGHYAPATLKNFLQLTHLTEQDEDGNDSRSLIKKLLSDHESIIAFIRGNIDEFAEAHKDAGTSDYITGLMEKHEKTAWMLRAHLK
ncbi:DNA starvation/stationary phase protection protein [Spirosoma sp. HMF3257]|uniref:DNA starvation/stationary phase protection protein n=1 Tax=Spirosoma telluris TaxID=2183553 RepID=A0A327NRX1_9BACT|nr:DNA starvation/stationary phase protection protein [Spirosoma telluris]RAI78141.1 DNA starvation/stationary phase protection protein [Spirosoma telluris]